MGIANPDVYRRRGDAGKGAHTKMQIEFFWTLGQLGILLEIGGALYIALSSIGIHRSIGRLFVDIFGIREIPRIIETMQNQARTDITGFLLLAGGLLLQFVGNFGAI
jgi:hypothetical protein